MSPWLRALPMLTVVLGLGCQNNTITLETDPDPDSGNESSDPTEVATMTTGNDTMSDTTGNPGGPQTLLLALNTPLQPGLPLQAIVTTTPGTGTVDVTLQWLSLDIGSTTAPRQPIGDLYAYPALPVDATGTFYWDTGIILIPGAANPISGVDIVASVQANVVPAGTPTYCGLAGGTVLMPVESSLEGTTHAMTAVPDAASLPVDFLVACP